MARLTPIQKTAMQWFTEGYTYIECDPRGYKQFKLQTIRSLVKKGYIALKESRWNDYDPYYVGEAIVLIPVPLTADHPIHTVQWLSR